MKNEMNFEHLTDDEIDILENFLKNKSDSWFELFVCTSFLDDYSLSDDSTEQADDLEVSFFFHKVILANKEYVFKWCNQEACITGSVLFSKYSLCHFIRFSISESM